MFFAHMGYAVALTANRPKPKVRNLVLWIPMQVFERYTGRKNQKVKVVCLLFLKIFVLSQKTK